MKNLKKMLAAALAVSVTASLTACGAGNDGAADTSAPAEEITTTEKTEWTGDNIAVETEEGELDTEVDISGKTLKWLGIYDINPTNEVYNKDLSYHYDDTIEKVRRKENN